MECAAKFPLYNNAAPAMVNQDGKLLIVIRHGSLSPTESFKNGSGIHNFFQGIDGFLRIGMVRVIGADIRMPDDPFPVDDESCRQGQRPGIVIIEYIQFNAEFAVNRLDLFGQLVSKPLVGSRFVAWIAQHHGRQILFFHQLAAELNFLR